MKAIYGDWVKIHRQVLDSRERTGNIPLDTKECPLEMWVKGFLLNESANMGDQVDIETYIGRKVSGSLVEIKPSYSHNFKGPVGEILYIGRQAKKILYEEGDLDD